MDSSSSLHDPTDATSPRRRRSLTVTLMLVAGLLATTTSALGLGLVAPTIAGASTFDVVSPADDGSEGTLRHAITLANSTPGPHVIRIGEVGTITLGSALPTLSEHLTIEGPGAGLVTVDGGGNQVFRIAASKGSQRSLSVSGLRFTNPSSAAGGLLDNTWGNVVFQDVELSNIASNRPVFTKNGGTFRFVDSLAHSNVGAVISSDWGNTPSSTVDESGYENRTYIIRSTLRDNLAGGNQCAVYTERRLYVVDSEIVDNAAAGVCARGLNGASFSSSVVARNGGTGISLFGSSTTSVTQNDTTVDQVDVYDNGGVGIHNGYITNVSGSWQVWDPPGLRIERSSVFGNLAGDLGGPIAPEKVVDSLVGVPRPPSAVAGEPGHGEATVSWDPPTFDSGSPVTSYDVTATPGDAACTATETTCVVPDLEPGTPYTFTVTATNARGGSWPSGPSAPVTPTAATITTVPTTTVPTTTVAPPATDSGPGDVPSAAGPGEHHLDASGPSSRAEAERAVTVTPAPAAARPPSDQPTSAAPTSARPTALAMTGDTSTGMFVAGLLSSAVGMVMVAAGRARRSTTR